MAQMNTQRSNSTHESMCMQACVRPELGAGEMEAKAIIISSAIVYSIIIFFKGYIICKYKIIYFNSIWISSQKEKKNFIWIAWYFSGTLSN